MWLVLLLLLALASPVWAGQLDASWSAPTTFVDGSPLTDPSTLTYRLYWVLFPQTPCPGTQFIVTSPGQTTATLPTLTQGMTYNAQVTAVNTIGESACSLIASGVAAVDSPLPLGSALKLVFASSAPPPVGFTVTGVTPGQVVTGPLRVSAAANAGTTATGATFTLKNAAGTVIASNVEGAVPYCFVGDPGTLPCLPFDTTTVPNGAYTMTVSMATVPASPAQVIPFTVAH